MQVFHCKLLATAVSAILLSACGDAETNIVEKDPIKVEDDHNHGDGYLIESAGRLAVLSADSNTASIYNLDDKTLLGSFALTYDSSRLSASAGYRYALITTRGEDLIEFIDGGLWREDHGEHLHDYKQNPSMSTYQLMGSRPTHIVNHDGKLAVFYDGDANTGAAASVQVITDTDITNKTQSLPELSYAINMHGVAEPHDDYLITTVRRDDAESTSGNKILPDQVAVYHLHDNEYEQEHVFATACPDLHGAAQNEHYQVFGCSDGVLVTEKTETGYRSAKIDNIASLDGLRVGSVYSHHEVVSFVGVASQHGGGTAVLVEINPDDSEMENIDWQALDNAQPISYHFSSDGEHFLILDNLGYLTLLSAHQEGGHSHWEFETRIDISEEDVASMPDGMSFSMTLSQNSHLAFVADPIAQHIVQVDLESAQITAEIELNFTPASLTWLGIAETEHDADHDH
ncbi:hypothetical protein [Catenovulum maritimum]|uniref:5-methyltetrahydrofolate--homocysteine methyltransferase n=1 Tax=Catenovulum maritimum TaxID=1513271 RepID=A0A0J8JMG7_9ALTE|nr:hypothetical protein [Catenovulum maritimum]KMT65806.1 5-methyltetrahydrofolate--homocysteine methyltransferase [Catenovulum maritimum]